MPLPRLHMLVRIQTDSGNNGIATEALSPVRVYGAILE